MERDFKQIEQDVRQVIEMNESGKDISQIAATLNLDINYIKIILACAQGFTEDDHPTAIAHLVEMSL